jgi:hypothetical protein
MKIKRKEYERMCQELAAYQKLRDTRLQIMSADPQGNETPLLDVSMVDLYTTAYFGAYTSDTESALEYMTGTFRLVVTTPDKASRTSGYDYFLVDRYLRAIHLLFNHVACTNALVPEDGEACEPPDAPFNVFSRIHLTPDDAIN